jgi:hypothetical protein
MKLSIAAALNSLFLLYSVGQAFTGAVLQQETILKSQSKK